MSSPLNTHRENHRSVELNPGFRITTRSALPPWIMDSLEMEQIVKECNLIVIMQVTHSL